MNTLITTQSLRNDDDTNNMLYRLLMTPYCGYVYVTKPHGLHLCYYVEKRSAEFIKNRWCKAPKYLQSVPCCSVRTALKRAAADDFDYGRIHYQNLTGGFACLADPEQHEPASKKPRSEEEQQRIIDELLG